MSIFKLWIWNELIVRRDALRTRLTKKDYTHCDRGRRSLTVTELPGWPSNNAAGRPCEIRDASEGSDVKMTEDSEACIACEEIVEAGKDGISQTTIISASLYPGLECFFGGGGKFFWKHEVRIHQSASLENHKHTFPGISIRR